MTEMWTPLGVLGAPTGHARSSVVVAGTLERFMRLDSEHRIAVMLYGSLARGTADWQSDIDILEVVSKDPAPYVFHGANVTQYLPHHLVHMARAGSLFLLHLKVEGRTLSDPFGTLSRCLDSYVEPDNRSNLWEQLEVVSGAIDPIASDAGTYLQGLAKLAIYLLRTAVYLRCIENGQPTFDVIAAAQHVGGADLEKALAMRRKAEFKPDDLRALRTQLEQLVPGCWANRYGSVEAFAVANADRRDVAALLAGVLSEAGAIKYSALTLPPL